MSLALLLLPIPPAYTGSKVKFHLQCMMLNDFVRVTRIFDSLVKGYSVRLGAYSRGEYAKQTTTRVWAVYQASAYAFHSAARLVTNLDAYAREAKTDSN